jgi:tRNA 2-thiouridine synthesizing protein B
MATLHLASRSPADSRSLEQCLVRAGKGDAVLLMEDAVYAAVKGTPSGAMLRAAGVAIHVLIPDLEARGLQVSALAPDVRPVDYRGFVELTVVYNPIVSWF